MDSAINQIAAEIMNIVSEILGILKPLNILELFRNRREIIEHKRNNEKHNTSNL